MIEIYTRRRSGGALWWHQQARKRLQLPERLGYAHTLAHSLLDEALGLHEWREELEATRERCVVTVELLAAVKEREREKWKRYDRVTRFLFAHTAMY